jgi:hypothetical protein
LRVRLSAGAEATWILKCKKSVSIAQKGVALTQAQNAEYKTGSYWNYGPAVTAKHVPASPDISK